MKGNTAGLAVGQATFATDLTGSESPDDGNYAWEGWYSYQVTDNITLTPAVFYLSRPLGQLTPSNNSQAGISPMANFKIIVTIPMFDNEGNLQGIETTFCTVFNKLAASAIVFNVTSVSAPSVLSVAAGDYLTADLQISVLTSWS